MNKFSVKEFMAVEAGHNRMTENERLLSVMDVAAYNFIELQRCINHVIIESDRGYLAEAKISTADVITQMKYLCECLEWSYSEVDQLGVDRLVEKVMEVKRTGWQRV